MTGIALVREDMTRVTSGAPYLRVIRSPRYFPLWLGQIVSNLSGPYGGPRFRNLT